MEVQDNTFIIILYNDNYYLYSPSMAITIVRGARFARQ